MKYRLILSIIFYALLLAVGAAAGILYEKDLSPKQPPLFVSTAQKSDVLNGNIIMTKPDVPAANAPASPSPAHLTCIITVDGQQYDVQPLRNTHSGGDVFQCDTDMSAVFHGQHGDNLKMIQKYLVK